jgi:hypothetical protein
MHLNTVFSFLMESALMITSLLMKIAVSEVPTSCDIAAVSVMVHSDE